MNKVLGRQALYPLKQSIPLVEAWFSSPLGKAIFNAQQHCLEGVLKKLYGSSVLQLSILRDPSFKTLDCALPLAMGPLPGGAVQALCDDGQLPVGTNLMDIAVIHHYMEYSQNPHQLLKEVSRILTPSGYVVIVGFNPHSFLGLRSVFGRFQRQGILHNHPVSAKRIADWLTLLDFTVTDVRYGFYQLPFNTFSHSRKFNFINRYLNAKQWPLGGFYVLIAKKEVAPLTPTNDYLELIRKSMIPIMEPSLYTSPKKMPKQAEE